ncbi:hypothetical protein [Mesorhizobium sp. B2-3-5]|uniref:hypothetical protein n=1 Tax=Mesorhizobium sp. B2-3-5 TaxID=2589958 RepID=UPI0011268D11|nr:hypothetical protein [Mesorhizobium sp. B2-3-5]
MNVSLNDYYDLLKVNVTGIKAEEFLQLKLVADPVSISNDKASAGGYIWWSYYNLLDRGDHVVVPQAVDDQVAISAARLANVYGDFLNILIKFVAKKNLTPPEEKELANLQKQIAACKKKIGKLLAEDTANWEKYARGHGFAVGDQGQYLKWSQYQGNWDDVLEQQDLLKDYRLDRKILLNGQYPDPEDRKIRDQLDLFDSLPMQLGYPVHADHLYSNGDSFDVGYLSTMAGSENAMFDSRRYVEWKQDLKTILTTGGGHFDATLDHSTGTSTSMTTDWGASGSGSYAFISAHANVSEHTAIQEDFNTLTQMNLHCESAFRVEITYGGWFDPTLFDCQHVIDNPHTFAPFLGDKGSLLYYPTSLILVRGFAVEFLNTQNWSYDYDHSFSASAGGGFSCCGISFGASANYSEHTHAHKIDQATTHLVFKDDVNTIRFVGLGVVKNTAFMKAWRKNVKKIHGRG